MIKHNLWKVFKILLIFLFVFCMNMSITFAKDKVAALKGMKGAVEFKSADGGTWSAASDGMVLYAQDSVRTKVGAEVQIVFKEGHKVKLNPLSTVQIKVPRKPTKKEPQNSTPVSDVKNTLGKVYAKVKKSTSGKNTFEVSTPTAIAGVRGTMFAVEVDEKGDTLCSVQEGTVAMENDAGDEVLINEGEQVDVNAETAGIPEQPSPMTEEEKKEWDEQQEWIEGGESEPQEEGKLEEGGDEEEYSSVDELMSNPDLLHLLELNAGLPAGALDAVFLQDNTPQISVDLQTFTQ